MRTGGSESGLPDNYACLGGTGEYTCITVWNSIAVYTLVGVKLYKGVVLCPSRCGDYQESREKTQRGFCLPRSVLMKRLIG